MPRLSFDLGDSRVESAVKIRRYGLGFPQIEGSPNLNLGIRHPAAI
jgi:hypothetical protein